jgi:hypothetical protein
MGLIENEALILARNIGMFNGEAIYYVKNSLMLITPKKQKELDDRREQLLVIAKTKFPGNDPELIIATTKNNQNHDLTKLDVDLIKDMLLEGKKDEHLD